MAAVARGDSVILAGQTHLHWNGSIAGKRCFAVVLLDADGDMLWKWQVGRIFSSAMHETAYFSFGNAIVSKLLPLV